jgi:hypothetical protein
MSASRRWLLPACALALVAAGALHGCGGAECLRDSDCDSELECRRGACLLPLPKNPAGTGGMDAVDASDGSLTDAGLPDAARPDGSTPNAGRAGANSAADAGEGGGGGMSF